MPSLQLRIRAVEPKLSVIEKNSLVPMRKDHEMASASRCCTGNSGASFHCNNPRISVVRLCCRCRASSTIWSKRFPPGGGGGRGGGAGGFNSRGAEGTVTPRPSRMSARESRGIPSDVNEGPKSKNQVKGLSAKLRIELITLGLKSDLNGVSNTYYKMNSWFLSFTHFKAPSLQGPCEGFVSGLG